MDTKYVGKKTGKMALQTGGSNTIALAIYFALKRFDVEMSPDEVVVYMVAFTMAGNALIKFIEKVRK